MQTLMYLALPRFAGLADGPHHVHPPWSVVSDSPASPAPNRATRGRGLPLFDGPDVGVVDVPQSGCAVVIIRGGVAGCGETW